MTTSSEPPPFGDGFDLVMLLAVLVCAALIGGCIFLGWLIAGTWAS